VSFSHPTDAGCSTIYRVGYSQKGWTDSVIGVEWIKDFERKTREKAAGEPRLVLVDGHNSHYSPELLDYARDTNIILVCYPAHTTHVLQGLDVAVFGPFKRQWTRSLAEAWTRSFTPENIKAGFRKTGVYPLNPNVIPSEAIAPSKETSIQAPGPVELPSPLKRVSANIATKRGLEPTTPTRTRVPIDVFYTPTKTRSIPLDPIILPVVVISNYEHLFSSRTPTFPI